MEQGPEVVGERPCLDHVAVFQVVRQVEQQHNYLPVCIAKTVVSVFQIFESILPSKNFLSDIINPYM